MLPEKVFLATRGEGRMAIRTTNHAEALWIDAQIGLDLQTQTER